MSMMGNFLRIATRKIDALRVDASQIAKLLYPEDVGDTIASEDALLEVGKAWHGIHFLLNEQVWTGTPPLDFIVAGEELGDVDVGYGPARGFDADQVRAIAAALTPITEAVLRARCNPAAPGWNEVYPINGAPSAKDIDYFVAEYLRLRDFVLETAELGAGMIAYVN